MHEFHQHMHVFDGKVGLPHSCCLLRRCFSPLLSVLCTSSSLTSPLPLALPVLQASSEEYFNTHNPSRVLDQIRKPSVYINAYDVSVVYLLTYPP